MSDNLPMARKCTPSGRQSRAFPSKVPRPPSSRAPVRCLVSRSPSPSPGSHLAPERAGVSTMFLLPDAIVSAVGFKQIGVYLAEAVSFISVSPPRCLTRKNPPHLPASTFTAPSFSQTRATRLIAARHVVATAFAVASVWLSSAGAGASASSSCTFSFRPFARLLIQPHKLGNACGEL